MNVDVDKLFKLPRVVGVEIWIGRDDTASVQSTRGLQHSVDRVAVYSKLRTVSVEYTARQFVNTPDDGDAGRRRLTMDHTGKVTCVGVPSGLGCGVAIGRRSLAREEVEALHQLFSEWLKR